MSDYFEFEMTARVKRKNAGRLHWPCGTREIFSDKIILAIMSKAIGAAD